MPVTPTYPGVYIEEIPSGVHPITGVATSIAAFVDFFKRGPMNEAAEVFSFADFERVFGGLDTRSRGQLRDPAVLPQRRLTGVGGPRCVDVGDEQSPTKASVIAQRDDVRRRRARVHRDRTRASGATASGLDIDLRDVRTPRPALQPHRDGGRDPREPCDRRGQRGVPRAVHGHRRAIASSRRSSTPTRALIRLDRDAATALPRAVGLDDRRQTSPPSRQRATSSSRSLHATTTRGYARQRGVRRREPRQRADRHDRRRRRPLEAALQAVNPSNPAWAQATVRVMGERLQVLPGLARPAAVATFTAATAGRHDGWQTLVAALPTDDARGQRHELLARLDAAVRRSRRPVDAGQDGMPPDGADLIGSGAAMPPTGLHALDKVDLFNILCLPRVAQRRRHHRRFPSGHVARRGQQAISYCEHRRAFFIVDTPSDVDNVAAS